MIENLKPCPFCVGDSERSTGWLSPSGEFFPVNLYGHLDEAKKIAERIVPAYTVNYGQPDEFLLDRGWVGIYLWTFFSHEWAFAFRRNLTPEQTAYLDGYMNDWIPVESVSLARYEEQRDR